MYTEVGQRHEPPWQIHTADGPLLAVAVHNGHAVRQDVANLLALAPPERLREEDPYTGRWTAIAPSRVIVQRSRFEVDLNRPRDKAVYLDPADAWGLSVWKESLPSSVVSRSLAIYDRFYRTLHQAIARLVRRYGRVVVLDLHSYNYRRAGPDQPSEDPVANPDINIGTGTMDRPRWARVVERAVTELRAADVEGRQLDVRENVRFFGGHFPRWVHDTFPESACALAIEVKKFFMDEWTGELDEGQFAAVGRALASMVPGLIEELQRSDLCHQEQRRRHVRRAGEGRHRAAGAQPARPPQSSR
jgi:N-formylglutamate amidohydrolase